MTARLKAAVELLAFADQVAADEPAHARDLRALAQSLRRRYHDWTPVTADGDLPAVAEAVFIQFEDASIGDGPHVELGEIRGDGRWYVSGDREPAEVTHWQPLPRAAGGGR